CSSLHLHDALPISNSLPNLTAYLWIWIASARAGARISARGSPGLRSARAGRVSRRFITATRNARVLPVPVWAWPATSPPGSATGRVMAWMGVQRTKPAASRPASSCGCRSDSEKGTSVRGLSLMRWECVVAMRGRAREGLPVADCGHPGGHRLGPEPGLDQAGKRPSLTVRGARHISRAPAIIQEKPVSEKVIHTTDAEFEA